MTTREFYKAVLAMDNVDAEVRAYAVTALAKKDESNAKRRNTPSKTQVQNVPIIEAISAFLAGKTEPQTAADISAAVGISLQKASALAKKVEGVVVSDIKVKGKGTQKGYMVSAE